jgi:hypothetical protein
VKVGPGADINGAIDVTNNFVKAATFTYDYSQANDPAPYPSVQPNYTVLLRRLANPHMPWDVNITSPTYNPYVTIDYMNNIVLYDGGTTGELSIGKMMPYAASPRSYVQYYNSQNLPKPVNPPALKTTTHTFGSVNDPNVSYLWLTHLDRQLISPMELLNVSGFVPHQLTHRFLDPTTQTDKNQPPLPIFAPYAHRVATTPPNNYTPVISPANGLGHPTLTAPALSGWFDERTRLYRAFEFLSTRERGGMVSPSGRVPGTININTMWDLEVWRALCDPQNGNGFNWANPPAGYQMLVDQIFTPLPTVDPSAVPAAFKYNQQGTLLALRSPGMVPPQTELLPNYQLKPTSTWVPTITGKDRPFLGMGIGNLPAYVQNNQNNDAQNVFDDGTAKQNATKTAYITTGVDDTILRSLNGNGFTDQRLFDVPDPQGGSPLHPYQKGELLSKIYGQLTTRSNVFAVWLTVGFFEVAKDPTTGQYVGDQYRPVKLGAELGAATNTNIRPRYFTVIDRTKMAIAPKDLVTKDTDPKTGLPIDVTTVLDVQAVGLGGTLPGPNAVIPNTKPPQTLPNMLNQAVAVKVRAPDSNTYPGQPLGANKVPWQIQPLVIQPQGAGAPSIVSPGPGPTVLVVDNGTPNEETVVVEYPPGWTAAGPRQPPQPGDWMPPTGQQQPTYWIFARFQKEHGIVRDAQGNVSSITGNMSITIPGNPGPQPTFRMSAQSGDLVWPLTWPFAPNGTRSQQPTYDISSPVFPGVVIAHGVLE